MCFLFLFFFFFQAEDGIRDYKVTGVQTCALPILPMVLRGRRTTPATPALALLPVAPGIAASLGGPASVAVLWKILTYFAGASLFVFGSGLAIVPFLYGGVVRQFHWLTERQFIDAVAVSMI